MFFLAFLVSIIRMMLLFYGAIFTFLLGETFYRYINSTLFTFAVPCMEAISLIIAVSAPVAYFFGIHTKQWFFQRVGLYNAGIFAVAFLFGTTMTFLPAAGTPTLAPFCTEQASLAAKVLQSLITGVLTAFIAYVSFDIGVYQASYLTPILRRAKLTKKQ